MVDTAAAAAVWHVRVAPIVGGAVCVQAGESNETVCWLGMSGSTACACTRAQRGDVCPWGSCLNRYDMCIGYGLTFGNVNANTIFLMPTHQSVNDTTLYMGICIRMYYAYICT